MGLPSPSSPGLKAKMKVLASLASYLEPLEANLLPSLFRCLEFSSCGCRAEVPISLLVVSQEPLSVA